jgi:hypothetical protein
MYSRTKRNLAAAAAVAVFAGGGALAAMAATGHAPVGRAAHGHRSTHRGAVGGPLGKAAGYLGVSPAQLRHDLKSGRTLGEVADATPGRSEAGLIEVLEAARRAQLAASAAGLTRRVTAQVRRPYCPSGLARGALFNARVYLGLTPAQLRADRRSGLTLAQIAEQTPGKSQAGLVEALAAARREALAAAVAAGTLTAAEDQARAAKLTKRVSALVEHRPSRARQRHSG